MTVLEFKRPDPPKAPEDPLYFVTLYPNATHFDTPDGEGSDDIEPAANAIFDATFGVWNTYDGCLALIAIGANRTTSMREPHIFDTPAQRLWLRRRLDETYYRLTGESRPSILDRLKTFVQNLFRLKGDPE